MRRRSIRLISAKLSDSPVHRWAEIVRQACRVAHAGNPCATNWIKVGKYCRRILSFSNPGGSRQYKSELVFAIVISSSARRQNHLAVRDARFSKNFADATKAHPLIEADDGDLRI